MQHWLRSVSRAAAGASVVGIVGLAFAGGGAQATEGYFQHGYGARQQALAGAGVADSRDAMSLSLNPAGLVDVDRQFQFGASLFAPFREYKATGPGFVAPGATSGTIESSSNYFVVPNIAYSHPIDAESAWGIALFGNGGMNTTYKGIANSNCPPPGPGGVFCGGDAGVDLMQAFLTVGYARRIGALSVGIAPVFVIQRFKADGLGVFAPFSSDPGNLTNRGYDYSYGGGVRGGVQWNVTNKIRFGVSAQTPMWMTNFDKYRGLFAGQGGFDIPANVTAGVAMDVTPTVTVMLDYKHIFYASVPSVGNSSQIALPFGASGGPGFGWHDVDIVKVGAEWRASPAWTFRVGYAHNTNPIKSSDVTLNILAPGVVTDHITGGFSYKVTPNSTLEFAAAFIPEHRVSGIEVTPVGPNPARTVELAMHQFQFTLGWTYRFDQAPAAAPIMRK